jgi:hypothetical protein
VSEGEAGDTALEEREKILLADRRQTTPFRLNL